LADHHHREPISANTLRGATFLGGGSGDIGGVFAGNVVKYNGQHGIYVAGEHWLVEGNRVEANSRTTNDTLRLCCLVHRFGGYFWPVLSELSFLEALIRAILAMVGFALASGAVLVVMGFLSGRD
jgi:hypothetical protein